MSSKLGQFLQYSKVSLIFSVLYLVSFTVQAVVIGSDQRISIDVSYYPSSAIAKIKFDQNNQKKFCTAPLIAPNIAVTNAHCLDKSSNIQFVINDQVIKVKKIWVSPKYHSTSKLNDYGFIILAEDIAHSTGWFELKNYKHESMANKKVFELQGFAHDMGKNRKFFGLETFCSTKHKVSKNVFTHDCDTNSGSSGSPLFINSKSLSRAVLLGINMKSNSKKNCSKYDSKSCSNYAVSSTELALGLKQFLAQL